MSSSLQGKVILITGAASGIGRATAVKLASLGARLALTDTNEKGLLETAELASPAEVITAELDVSNSAQVNVVIAETIQYFTRLDHVFNCAGVNPTAYSLTEVTDEYFDKLVGVNLKGTFNVTRAAIPHMKDHSGCSFVNVSSVLGQRPGKEVAVYCATKFAIIGFTKCMALELGSKGIRTNAVTPGNINTPTNSSVVEGAESVARSAAAASLGRMGEPADVADVVAFLMSEEARYMNGSIVEINGGLPI